MRRTTLGVPSANASSRNGPGVPPGRAMSHVGGHLDRRSSAIPMAGSRRSSVMSATSRAGSISSRRGTMQFAGRKADPRPTSDRQFMAFCVKNLVTFVIERGYEEPISAKILTNPTSKDFQNIFAFMIMRCAPFQFHRRFEEDIPIVLKFFGYPFTLSKSALTAVGSPHTWPTLLGVLSWLCELLKYGEESESKKEKEIPSFAEGRQQVFHADLMNGYEEFLSGCEDYDRLDEDLRLKFEERSAQNVRDIDTLVETLKEREIQLSELRSNPSPLQQASGARHGLEMNNKKLSSLIHTLQANFQQMQSHINTRNTKIVQQEELQEENVQENNRLAAILETQAKNSIDAEEIGQRRAELRKALQQTAKEESIWENDLSLCSKDLFEQNAEFKKLLSEYEKNADYLTANTASMENANGINFRVRFNADESVTDPSKVLSVNMDDAITPALRNINHDVGQEIMLHKDKDLKLQDKLDEMELKQVQKREQISALRMEFSRLEKDFLEGKDALAEERKKRSESNVESEDQLSARRRENNERVLECQKRQEHFIEQSRKMERQFEEEKRRVALLILEDIQIIRERQQKMLRLINNLRRDARSGHEAGAGLPPTIPKK